MEKFTTLEPRLSSEEKEKLYQIRRKDVAKAIAEAPKQLKPILKSR